MTMLQQKQKLLPLQTMAFPHTQYILAIAGTTILLGVICSLVMQVRAELVLVALMVALAAMVLLAIVAVGQVLQVLIPLVQH